MALCCAIATSASCCQSTRNSWIVHNVLQQQADENQEVAVSQGLVARGICVQRQSSSVTERCYAKACKMLSRSFGDRLQLRGDICQSSSRCMCGLHELQQQHTHLVR